MTKRYNNPPIVEVLCEFQFVADAGWDLTLLGQIYDKLEDFFPKKLQLPLNFAVTINSQTNGQTGTAPMIPLVRFLDNDEKKLVQIGQDFLTVNHVKPYDSWKEFLPFIEKAFEAYCEIAKPKVLQHLAIRYINRIEVLGSNPNLEELFRIRPYIPPDLAQGIESFLLGVNLSYEDVKDTLRIQLGTVNPDVPDILVLLLEIGYFFAKPGEIALGDVLRRVDKAQKYIEDAFESCLTDELKQTFGEVKE